MFRPRPPRGWELFTFALLLVIAATVAAGAFILATYLAILRYLSAGESSSPEGLLAFFVRNGATVETLYLLLSVAYLFLFALWRRSTRAVLERHRQSADLMRHWSVAAWGVLFVLSLAVRFAAIGDRGLQDQVRAYVIGNSVRVAAIVLLCFGVWQIRDRVRRAVAQSDVAPTPRDLGVKFAPTTAAPARVRQNTTLDVAALPPADDDFWTRAGALARSQHADLPLLESTSTLVRRWLLIPADGETGPLRASLTPGTVVTVFAGPLRPAAEVPQEPPTGADEWFGLIEDNGALRYQSVKPNRLPVWLSQARAARRFGLYRATDGSALTAVVPAPRAASSPA